MSKGGQKTTQTTDQTNRVRQEQMLDPRSRAYVENFLRPLGQQAAQAAQGVQSAGPNQYLMQALGGLSGAASNRFTPSAMDPNRASDFFNPYQQEVVSALQSDFDRQRAGARTQANQLATAEGAFGGSRSAILQAQALNDVNQNEASTLANVRNQGYAQAQNLAAREYGTMQNLGLQGAQLQNQNLNSLLGGAQALQGIQQRQAMDPLMRYRSALQFANLGMGPTGSVNSGMTSTQGTTTAKESGKGFFDSLLGMAPIAAGFFMGGPGGAVAASGAAGGGGGPSINYGPYMSGEQGFFDPVVSGGGLGFTPSRNLGMGR